MTTLDINIKTIYEKVRNGDPLSDNELLVGSKHFNKAVKMLVVLGPQFEFATNELRRVAMKLDDFIDARKGK